MNKLASKIKNRNFATSHIANKALQALQEKELKRLNKKWAAKYDWFNEYEPNINSINKFYKNRLSNSFEKLFCPLEDVEKSSLTDISTLKKPTFLKMSNFCVSSSVINDNNAIKTFFNSFGITVNDIVYLTDKTGTPTNSLIIILDNMDNKLNDKVLDKINDTLLLNVKNAPTIKTDLEELKKLIDIPTKNGKSNVISFSEIPNMSNEIIDGDLLLTDGINNEKILSSDSISFTNQETLFSLKNLFDERINNRKAELQSMRQSYRLTVYKMSNIDRLVSDLKIRMFGLRLSRKDTLENLHRISDGVVLTNSVLMQFLMKRNLDEKEMLYLEALWEVLKSDKTMPFYSEVVVDALRNFKDTKLGYTCHLLLKQAFDNADFDAAAYLDDYSNARRSSLFENIIRNINTDEDLMDEYEKTKLVNLIQTDQFKVTNLHLAQYLEKFFNEALEIKAAEQTIYEAREEMKKLIEAFEANDYKGLLEIQSKEKRILETIKKEIDQISNFKSLLEEIESNYKIKAEIINFKEADAQKWLFAKY